MGDRFGKHVEVVDGRMEREGDRHWVATFVEYWTLPLFGRVFERTVVCCSFGLPGTEPGQLDVYEVFVNGRRFSGIRAPGNERGVAIASATGPPSPRRFETGASMPSTKALGGKPIERNGSGLRSTGGEESND